MKRYAIINYQNVVQAIENRASCFWKSEKGADDKWAIEDLAHPDMLGLYVEITEETGEAQIGMLYSDGEFIENPVAPDSRITALEEQQAATSQAVLGLMDMMNL